MKTEIDIIRLFIGDKNPKTIREISKTLEKDYKIIHTAVQLLVNKKIIMAENIGSSTLCRLSNNYGIEIHIAESERRENILKNKNIEQINKEINTKIKTSFYILLLFGSYAKNKQKIKSDIDLMFISNEKDFENKVSDIINLMPLKVHALTFTEEEFIRMKNNKELNIVKEGIENNIILYDIEGYYRIKNA
ncbi:nucleotidyltransferase domain-containing protein [Candidatus Woesearchaeota archaeon]|nr:nucleotidyltransferase domain-containing protein [Candidatus Woesearchaeota archaeon]HIH25839.1 nucleotidyltransferase domain-containing protein [Nanoarchaeota archaeon]